ncbi:MAG: hypothetical protein [Wendovervirus sonii]|uniref:Uncharacterized protein n=1 Tax=phage Lak_Megaphage_Sonny TaxID=3109229 RepID=A0ABZ0Z367_9CAUD|nr:MAG: hypothetical protein [phage Lak_Megaphage_Sonny]
MAKFKKFDTFFESEHHFNDVYTNLGYDFDSNIMKNVLSPEMFANPANDTPLRQIERLIEFLVHQVKRIKLEYDFTMPKNSKKLN